MENGTYIRIYGATEAPHMFPKFVPNKLVLQEVAYRTLVNGVGAVLVRDKKLTWPPLPFWLGSYCFKDVKEAQAKVDTLEKFHFGEERFRRHYPLKIVSSHYQVCKYKRTYESETQRDEEIHKRVVNYDEVIFRMRGSSQHSGKLQQQEEVKATREKAEKKRKLEAEAKAAAKEEEKKKREIEALRYQETAAAIEAERKRKEQEEK